MVLACLQILAVTVLFFIGLAVNPGTSAVMILINYSIMIIIVSPSASFLYIFMSFLFENFFPVFRRCHTWALWVLMLVVFALYGLYPVWSAMYGPGVFVIVSITSCIIALGFYSYYVAIFLQHRGIGPF